MKSAKLFKAALQSIARNRMRSALTMLGIIIGVGAVIVMVAVGQGSQRDIEERISSFGTNLLTIFPQRSAHGGVSRGADSGNSLTLQDVDILRRYATTLAGVTPVARTGAQVVGGKKNWSTTVYGVSPEYEYVRNHRVETGEFFSERDVAARAKVAVIGSTVAGELFPGQNPIGQQLRIGNTPFIILGVLESKGQGGWGVDQDDVVLAPVSTVMVRLIGDSEVRQILASGHEGGDLYAAEQEVRQLLRRAHRLRDGEDDDFRIRNQTEIMDMASETSRTLTLLLGAIAGVSLLVGGIGIMNIMLVSVTERTREIGIRMAVGARPTDVLAQFLVEAIVLSMLGGLIGVLVSFITAAGLNHFEIRTEVHSGVIALSLGFSAAVGIFFGFWPARKAAAMDPIQALRHE